MCLCLDSCNMHSHQTEDREFATREWRSLRRNCRRCRLRCRGSGCSPSRHIHGGDDGIVHKQSAQLSNAADETGSSADSAVTAGCSSELTVIEGGSDESDEVSEVANARGATASSFRKIGKSSDVSPAAATAAGNGRLVSSAESAASKPHVAAKIVSELERSMTAI